MLKQKVMVPDFQKEFMVMSSIISPYIVKFFGVCLNPQIGMVMEYCPQGSLFDFMRKEGPSINWDTFFKYTIQMTKGINVLHTWTPVVLHRDLKSMNLLINSNLDVVLADFGLSRFSTDTQKESLMRIVGTIAWVAPEVFEGTSVYNPKCDIYSLSMIIWELLYTCIFGSHAMPYSEFHKYIKIEFMIANKVHDEMFRPTIPECPEGIREIIKLGLSSSQEKRPDCEKMILLLEEQESLYKKEKSKWDSYLQRKSGKKLSFLVLNAKVEDDNNNNNLKT